MATVYNYTGEDLKLFEVDWDNEVIKNYYLLSSAGKVEIKVKDRFKLRDNIEVERCENLELPEPKQGVIYIVSKNICKILGNLRPDLRYPEGKIVDPDDEDNVGYSLLLDYTH